ncbi:hypothetical protein PUR28_03015, partial [Streptomyces sp. BE308]|uniref:hypothetical protein n=1 Tax=Streptomyces sp. BE308 TaxID=3002529 RepID=UPI002E78CD35
VVLWGVGGVWLGVGGFFFWCVCFLWFFFCVVFFFFWVGCVFLLFFLGGGCGWVGGVGSGVGRCCCLDAWACGLVVSVGVSRLFLAADAGVA